jgi:ubiquinone/menaquinone biosynthesis C-methylase UbiE
LTLFDKEATNYDKWYETKIGEYADQVETNCAFNLFQPKPGMKILDVGCGTGNFSIKMASQGVNVTGVDISEKMLEFARNRAAQEKLAIEFRTMDTQNLTFQDNFFDGVFSMATIEFVSEPDKMIEEMFRVCKKGGPVVVGTINKDSTWGELYQDPEFQKNVPVFKYADLKVPKDLSKIKQEYLIKVSECLFLAPDTPETEISLEQEKKLSTSNSGGFFCVLWRKK